MPQATIASRSQATKDKDATFTKIIRLAPKVSDDFLKAVKAARAQKNMPEVERVVCETVETLRASGDDDKVAQALTLETWLVELRKAHLVIRGEMTETVQKIFDMAQRNQNTMRAWQHHSNAAVRCGRQATKQNEDLMQQCRQGLTDLGEMSQEWLLQMAALLRMKRTDLIKQIRSDFSWANRGLSKYGAKKTLAEVYLALQEQENGGPEVTLDTVNVCTAQEDLEFAEALKKKLADAAKGCNQPINAARKKLKGPTIGRPKKVPVDDDEQEQRTTKRRKKRKAAAAVAVAEEQTEASTKKKHRKKRKAAAATAVTEEQTEESTKKKRRKKRKAAAATAVTEEQVEVAAAAAAAICDVDAEEQAAVDAAAIGDAATEEQVAVDAAIGDAATEPKATQFTWTGEENRPCYLDEFQTNAPMTESERALFSIMPTGLHKSDGTDFLVADLWRALTDKEWRTINEARYPKSGKNLMKGYARDGFLANTLKKCEAAFKA